MMLKHQANNNIKRAAHPKGHGLVKGYFTISPNLPNAIRVGLFKEPGCFSALIRFSNANPMFTSDKLKDIRGCAIKLIPNSHLNTQQDFILASCPKIAWGTWHEFSDTLYWGLKNPLYLFFKTVVQGTLSKYLQMYQMMNHDTSPLDIPYWSITPYALGKSPVKYVLIPTSNYQSTLPDKLTASYLSDNMQQHLLTQPASFDFCIQLPKEQENVPIDDLSILWSKEMAPLIKVAQLEIPSQIFKITQRNQLMEKLVYSPANSLSEHRPLGEINNARIKIYQELSDFRHLKNNTSPITVTEKEFTAME